jgi:hypothetical protein
VVHALEKNKEEKFELIHMIRIFEGNLKVMYQSVFSIKIIVSKVDE